MAVDKQVVLTRVQELIKDLPDAQRRDISERDVCRHFIEPLFEVLGWKIRSLDEVREQKGQPSGRPDYIFFINGRIAFYLESKNLDQISDVDIKQAVNYGRNNGHRWVILSNFQETFVLICDTKEKGIRGHIFLQIPADKIEERLDSLLLLSNESFRSGSLDSKAQELGRVKQTVSIGDELLEDLQIWRKKLIASIKENNTKQYSKDELEEIVQTILNRIIFIRTVEDRKHEAYADETIERMLTEFKAGRITHLYERLNKLFREYDETYDSQLFTHDETDPKRRYECERVQLGDDVLFKILKGTYEKNEIYTYNFKDINADVLGAMYEKYLGSLRAQKEHGSYYTHTYIVEYIIRNTVGELLKNKKQAEVDKIKILDPACGSGSFLIKAFDAIDDYYIQKDPNYVQSELVPEDESAKKTRKTKILTNNIYGIDLDETAVEITQLNLLLKAAETKYRLPNIRENIPQGNSLIDDVTVAGDSAFKWEEKFQNIIQFNEDGGLKEGHGFDVIIGNPPWVSFGLRGTEKIDKKENDFYRLHYSSAEYKLSTYALFVERAIRSLKINGLFSFILPDSFLLGRYFSKLRRYILDNCEIKKILLTNYDVFSKKATTGRNVILVLKKRQPLTGKKIGRDVEIIRADTEEDFRNVHFETFTYSQNYFEKTIYNRFRLFFNEGDKKFVENVETDSELLEKFMTGHTGVRSLIGQKKIIAKAARGKTWMSGLISGSQIGRYWLRYEGDYINIDPKLLNKGGWDPTVILNDKLMIRQTGDQIYATLDTDKYYHLNNIHSFNLKNRILDIKYILALLNSKMMSAYYLLVTLEKGRVMAQTDIETLEKLPIKEISSDLQKPFIELVDRIIVLNRCLVQLGDKQTGEQSKLKKEITEIGCKIDELVYDLYGLTAEERMIVRKAIKTKHELHTDTLNV